MDDLGFVTSELPPPPSRVLEVGCGAGELARALADRRYDVTAIDPDAPDGPMFRRARIEELADPDPFDAVVAVRSLHHVADLAVALDAVLARLGPGGALVVSEFAHERLDGPTAEWYLGQRAILHASGRDHAPPADTASLRAQYDGLHTGEAVLTALRARFEERSFEWTPYLHTTLDGVASEELERTLVDSGLIEPVGFRWVGERPR